jgi:hypothetical protein
MYYTPIILFTVLFNRAHNATGFPDVFDPAFAASADASARAACAPRVNDSNVIGYFLDNENSCPPVDGGQKRSVGGGGGDGGAGDVTVLARYLALSPSAPGRVAAEEFLAARGVEGATANVVPSSTRYALQSEFSVAVAKKYFEVTTAAVRRHDPNHLVLGCKFMAVDHLGPVLAVSAPYVDAHALDIYAFSPGLHYLSALYAASRKPFIIAEYGFMARENMNPNKTGPMGGAGPVLDTQVQRGAAWQDFVNKALSLPFVVGLHHFQYMDQPWAPDDHMKYKTNYGIVSINDTEYTEFVSAMRATNANATAAHAAGASGQRCASDKGTWPTGSFRGYVVLAATLLNRGPTAVGRNNRLESEHESHSMRGVDGAPSRCLTAAGDGAVTVGLGQCGPESVWVELTSGVLQHASTGKCLDLDRTAPPDSPGVMLSANCSTSADVEAPSSWEHGADCLVMNFCRWLGNPVCGYEQTCLASVAPQSDIVQTKECIVGDAQSTWAFVATVSDFVI